MSNDILVMLEHSRLAKLMDDLEGSIQLAFENRHEYPVWPVHGDNPVDAFEESYHSPMRHVYYQSTIWLVRTLRALRTIV